MRTVVRRSCYVALPVAAILIVPGFWLMPNHKYDTGLADADFSYIVGYGMAAAGVALAAVSFLTLMLVAEE